MAVEPAKSVEVVVAAYNGAKFIHDQIESILNQSYPEITILIRDDGSTDGTTELVMEFQNAHPEKIRIIDDADGNLGVIGSFSKLLEHSTADYVFLSDQDDVWDKDKVSKQMDLMNKMERKFGNEFPLLIHSDLKLVDEKLNLIHPSVIEFIGRNPEKRGLNHMLITNFIAGCSILINRKLLDIAVPMPDGVLSHDGWLALVASAVGKIAYIPESLLLYRQHGTNVVGAEKGASVFNPFKLFSKIKKYMLIEDRLNGRIDQARILKTRTLEMLNPEQIKMIDTFTGLGSRNYFIQRFILLRYGFLKHKPIQILSQLFRIA